MMLHAVTRERLDPPIIPSNRQRHRDRPLRELRPRPFNLRNPKPLRDQIKLLARHPKRRMIINRHHLSRAIHDAESNFEGCTRKEEFSTAAEAMFGAILSVSISLAVPFRR